MTWTDLHQELTAVATVLGKVADAADAAKSSVDAVADSSPELRALQSSLDDLDGKLKDLRDESDEDPVLEKFQGDVERLKNSLSDLREQVDADPLLRQIRLSLSALGDQREAVERSSEDSDLLKNKTLELRDLKEQVVEADRRIGYLRTPEGAAAVGGYQASAEASQLEDKKKDLAIKIAAMQKEVDDLRKAEAPFKIDQERKAIELERLQKRIDELKRQEDARREILQKQLDDAQAKLDAADKALEARKKFWEDQVTALQKQADEAQKKLDKAKKDLEDLSKAGAGGGSVLLGWLTKVKDASSDASEHVGSNITRIDVAVATLGSKTEKTFKDISDASDAVAKKVEGSTGSAAGTGTTAEEPAAGPGGELIEQIRGQNSQIGSMIDDVIESIRALTDLMAPGASARHPFENIEMQKIFLREAIRNGEKLIADFGPSLVKNIRWGDIFQKIMREADAEASKRLGKPVSGTSSGKAGGPAPSPGCSATDIISQIGSGIV